MLYLLSAEKRYGHVVALRNLTCEIPINRFVVIMGPSGAGKSALLRLLSFVELPDQGTVRLNLDGRIFESSRIERPWPELTCVFQRQFLWPHLTLRKNISLPLRLLRVANAEERVTEVINLFDMSLFIERYPNEVSGGQAQRVALARALVLQPRVILIDEAHSGLDLEQQNVLNRHLLMLRKSEVGLIVVTHSLDFARRYADKVIILDKGQVTENGSRDILHNPNSSFLRRAIGLDGEDISFRL
jgi:ABC-type sulfate/molybdate transport systems ATPase subunit